MSELNIYEVGPRDGLQNSMLSLSTEDKISMITQLHKAGLKNIEVASFVHPKYVPQMADAEAVFEGTEHLGNFDVLIPNQRGFDRALKIGVENFNVFFSPSDEFNMRNLGKKLDEAYPEIYSMLEDIDSKNVRAYISCAFGCPFTGTPSSYKISNVLEKADEIADTIVLCDTIGAAYPSKLLQTLELTTGLNAEIALHLHQKKNHKMDIFQNVNAGIRWGITNFDASVGGLGGCPFIPESGSNLSTNELVNWAMKNNYETDIDLWELDNIAEWLIREELTTEIGRKMDFRLGSMSTPNLM